MTVAVRRRSRDVIPLLAAAMRAYDRAHALVECTICGANWNRDEGSECRWCAEALEVMREDQRRRLLHPEWLQIARHPGYLACSDADRRVWAQTRDIAHMEGAATFWADQLRRGVEAGLVTEHEATTALRRSARAVEAAS